MHVYKQILTFMLLSSAAISSEGGSDEGKWHRSRGHLKAPSGVPSPSALPLSPSLPSPLFTMDNDSETETNDVDPTTPLSSSVDSMSEEQLLQALGQSQETPSPYRPTGYEDLYELASIEAYTQRFKRDMDNSFISSIVFRPNHDGDIRDIFSVIFENLREKHESQKTGESVRKEYRFYQNNVHQLLIVWATITMCGEKIFDSSMRLAVKNLTSKDKDYHQAGLKLIQETVGNIHTLITFFDKWGYFITQIMQDQRRSLLSVRMKVRKVQSHVMTISSSTDPKSVTRQATSVSFDINPIIGRLRSQLQDAYMCLTLQFMDQNKILESEIWEHIDSHIQSREAMRAAIEQRRDTKSSISKKNVVSEPVASSSNTILHPLEQEKTEGEPVASSSKTSIRSPKKEKKEKRKMLRANTVASLPRVSKSTDDTLATPRQKSPSKSKQKNSDPIPLSSSQVSVLGNPVPSSLQSTGSSTPINQGLSSPRSDDQTSKKRKKDTK